MLLEKAELKAVDREIFDAIEMEKQRQQSNLEMIASENHTSVAVMEAMGSVMTNKYAEGYPAHRYYGGCQHVDIAESLAIERAKKTLRGGACQCTAPFRRPGQYGGLFCPAGTRRYRNGHGPVQRRASDPRQPGERVRETVSFCFLRRQQRNPAHRL